MKKLSILTILALFAATDVNAFDFDAHKDLAKKQMIEKAISEKSTDEIITEHKDLATGQIKDSVTSTAAEETNTTDTVDNINDTLDKVNTVKSWFN